MSTRAKEAERLAVLQGTLDLLILRILKAGPEHGHGIARAIHAQSGDVLLVDHGSLYPALQRLEARGLVTARWGTSENNRRARFYALTAPGKKQVAASAAEWRRFATAVGQILGPELSEG